MKFEELTLKGELREFLILVCTFHYFLNLLPKDTLKNY